MPAKATFLVDTTYHFGVSLSLSVSFFFCTFLALLTDDVCDNDDDEDDDDGDDNDDDDLIASGTHTAS